MITKSNKLSLLSIFFLTLLFMAVIVLFFPQGTSASNTWQIGLNEPSIIAYMYDRGLTCEPSVCTGAIGSNVIPMSITAINSRIYDLAGRQHIGTFREIIPVALVHPSSTLTNYQYVANIVKFYSGYNVNLILTLGLPVPFWMGVTSDWCPMPPVTDTAQWEALKNHLAWEMGDIVKYLWNDPRISKDWLRTHLFVEGFNEFDSVGGGWDAANQRCFIDRGTPARAASLENGINWVLNYYAITQTQYVMPSIVGVYAGYPGLSGAQMMRQYIIDYYAAFGTGLPNVHLYNPDPAATNSYVAMVSQIQSYLQTIVSGVPSQYQNRIVLGEVGAAVKNDSCTVAGSTAILPAAERQHYYRAIAANSYIAGHTEMITFWRIMDLPPGQTPSHPCETSYGVVSADNSGYNPAGANLFKYLGGAGCQIGAYYTEYFNNITLSGTPTFVGCENNVNYSWGTGGPGNGIGNDNFSVRWEGDFNFSQSQNYTFHAYSDDGIRVWLDGILIIDAWRDQGITHYQSTRWVDGGVHRIKVEYYEHLAGATVQVYW